MRRRDEGKLATMLAMDATCPESNAVSFVCARAGLKSVLAVRTSHFVCISEPMASPTSPSKPNLIDAAHANTEVAFKHLANQPTVGVFYISQHVRSSLPGLADNCRTLKTVGKTAQVCKLLGHPLPALITLKPQHVTVDAAELTECATTLSTHLSPLCTTLLEQVRQATSTVAELNQQRAESPSPGTKTWTSWLPRAP